MLWANGSKVLKQKVVGWFPRGDTFCPELKRYLDVGSIAVGMFWEMRDLSDGLKLCKRHLHNLPRVSKRGALRLCNSLLHNYPAEIGVTPNKSPSLV